MVIDICAENVESNTEFLMLKNEWLSIPEDCLSVIERVSGKSAANNIRNQFDIICGKNLETYRDWMNTIINFHRQGKINDGEVIRLAVGLSKILPKAIE